MAAAEAATSTQLDHGEGGLRFEGAALPAAAYSASPVLAELAEAGAAASLPLPPTHFRAWLRQTRAAGAAAGPSGAGAADRALCRLLNVRPSAATDVCRMWLSRPCIRLHMR